MKTKGEPALKRYVVRGGYEKREWAEVLITMEGFFAVVSSYGNWAYAWRDFGRGADFRAFLMQLNDGYIIGKLNGKHPDVYDGKRTLESVKQHICEYRRQESYDKERARALWEQLELYNDLEAEHDFNEWYGHADHGIDDAYEFACHEYPSDLRHFVKAMWPPFCEALKADLAAQASLCNRGMHHATKEARDACNLVPQHEEITNARGRDEVYAKLAACAPPHGAAEANKRA